MEGIVHPALQCPHALQRHVPASPELGQLLVEATPLLQEGPLIGFHLGARLRRTPPQLLHHHFGALDLIHELKGLLVIPLPSPPDQIQLRLHSRLFPEIL
ncbi:MAG: hypothetical protein EA422_08650, partial [Gemmatimonadales bacterium]